MRSRNNSNLSHVYVTFGGKRSYGRLFFPLSDSDSFWCSEWNFISWSVKFFLDSSCLCLSLFLNQSDWDEERNSRVSLLPSKSGFLPFVWSGSDWLWRRCNWWTKRPKWWELRRQVRAERFPEYSAHRLNAPSRWDWSKFNIFLVFILEIMFWTNSGQLFRESIPRRL
jgi:hypothetical protein